MARPAACSAATTWIAKAWRPSRCTWWKRACSRDYLLTRQPVRGFEGSNGRARLPGSYGATAAGISNLFVRSSETAAGGGSEEEADRAVQDARQALRHHRPQNGFSVLGFARRGAAAASGSAGERRARSACRSWSTRSIRTAARNWCAACASAGLNVRSLKDILAAGDDSTVFEFMDSPAPFALIGASCFTAEAAWWRPPF